jgi:DNA-binding winged helix-turn-helix (wHTH) protein
VTQDALDSVFASVPELRDDVEVAMMRARVAFAHGISDAALQAAQAATAKAERAGRAAELAEALALCARLHFVRGDKSRALAAAARVVGESARLGLARARTHGLLILAAVAREQGQLRMMAGRIREVAEIAAGAGLVVEHMVAAEAAGAVEGAAAEIGEMHNPAAATISDKGRDAARRLLSDLSLTATRPYRVIGPSGAESFVADASSDRLRMLHRSLVIDGVREAIIRDGETVANLRRRSLLKRLLFLFAGAPGQVFSKEQIVEQVWRVDYHPLRHDAALFTNIMRIRRLLGQDGADLIRVSEDGYRFVPPGDFLYVEPASAATGTNPK